MTVAPLETQLASAVAELRRAKSVAIVSHRDPDPDTIGSAIALGLALEGMGKRVTLHCADPVPENYRFLAGTERFATEPPARDVDLVVTVENAIRGSASSSLMIVPSSRCRSAFTRSARLKVMLAAWARRRRPR